MSYHKYAMFTDEENLIYEDDDDVEGWEDDIPSKAGNAQPNLANNEEKQRQIDISASFDQGYFVDRTLSSYSAPENRIWNLGTTLG